MQAAWQDIVYETRNTSRLAWNEYLIKTFLTQPGLL